MKFEVKVFVCACVCVKERQGVGVGTGGTRKRETPKLVFCCQKGGKLVGKGK